MSSSRFEKELARWWEDHQLVVDVWTAFKRLGGHLSRSSGESLQFKRVRPYEAGEPATAISHGETARTGQLMVEEHYEERRLPVQIIVDIRPRMWFGMDIWQKRELALFAAAALGASATAHHDPVTVVPIAPFNAFFPMTFSDQRVLGQLQEVHALSLFRESDLPSSVGTLLPVGDEASLVFVLSDCAPLSFANDLFWSLAPGSILFVIVVLDRAESLTPDEQHWAFPPMGIVAFRDESGGVSVHDTSSTRFRSRVVGQLKKRDNALKKLLRQKGSPFVVLTDPNEISSALTQLAIID